MQISIELLNLFMYTYHEVSVRHINFHFNAIHNIIKRIRRVASRGVYPYLSIAQLSHGYLGGGNENHAVFLMRFRVE